MVKPPAPKPAAKASNRAAKASSPGKKAAGKSPKAPSGGQRKDRRGTPKGKGTRAGGRGGKIGNPPHEPTKQQRQLANDLSAYGIPLWAIAEMMGISESTLTRHYAKELAMGPHRLVARAANMVAKCVLAGDKDYVKFVLARRGGPAWANKQETQISTPPGRPLETRDMTGLSREELRVLAKLHDPENRVGD